MSRVAAPLLILGLLATGLVSAGDRGDTKETNAHMAEFTRLKQDYVHAFGAADYEGSLRALEEIKALEAPESSGCL